MGHRLIRRVAVVVVATVVGGAALAAGTRLLAGEASGSPLSAEGTPGSPQRPLQSRGAAVAPALATNPDEIQGHVTLPVVGIVSATNPTTFAFKFSGLVNASPDQWSIAVDVLNPADADPGNETNWVYAVTTFRATGGGPDLFTFSVPGVTPFASLPDAWKPGGLGRMRVVAAMDADPNQWAALPVQDVNGVTPANPTTVVVGDNAPDPTLPPGQTLQSIKNPLNPATPNYLSANRQVLWYPPGHDAEQTAATNTYYSQIQTSARGTGTGQSIQEMLPTVQTFVNRYFGPFECSNPLNTPETVAKYFNKGDLGIGRELHCINRACTGELACYVKNFGKADGTPVFNNASQAKKALLQNHPFATVAMVERQLMATNGSNRVFFVAYNMLAASSTRHSSTTRATTRRCPATASSATAST